MTEGREGTGDQVGPQGAGAAGGDPGGGPGAQPGGYPPGGYGPGDPAGHGPGPGYGPGNRPPDYGPGNRPPAYGPGNAPGYGPGPGFGPGPGYGPGNGPGFAPGGYPGYGYRPATPPWIVGEAGDKIVGFFVGFFLNFVGFFGTLVVMYLWAGNRYERADADVRREHARSVSIWAGLGCAIPFVLAVIAFIVFIAAVRTYGTGPFPTAFPFAEPS